MTRRYGRAATAATFLAPRAVKTAPPGLQASTSGQFSIHEFDQRTHGCEGGAIDLVILDEETKALFKNIDQTHNCHRVQIRQGSQQRRVKLKLRGGTAQIQNLVENRQHFLLRIQNSLQSEKPKAKPWKRYHFPAFATMQRQVAAIISDKDAFGL